MTARAQNADPIFVWRDGRRRYREGVSTAEASRVLGIELRKLRRLLASGEVDIPSWRAGGTWRIDREWLYGPREVRER